MFDCLCFDYLAFRSARIGKTLPPSGLSVGHGDNKADKWSARKAVRTARRDEDEKEDDKLNKKENYEDNWQDCGRAGCTRRS